MAQNREKEETLELKVPSDSPLSLPTCKISKKRPGSDLTRIDNKPEPRPRSEDVVPEPAEAPETSGSGEAAKKVVKRCSGCRKRVGLTGFRCRCGDLFCPDHRYSDRHDCSYDYKKAGREAIARENPVVRAAKILKV